MVDKYFALGKHSKSDFRLWLIPKMTHGSVRPEKNFFWLVAFDNTFDFRKIGMKGIFFGSGRPSMYYSKASFWKYDTEPNWLIVARFPNLKINENPLLGRFLIKPCTEMLHLNNWLSQRVGSGQSREHVSNPRISGRGTTATAASYRRERWRSLQCSSSLASLPRTLQSHRGHKIYCRSH